MKDYTEIIEGIIPSWGALTNPTDCREMLKRLESIIRKDVEAEIERLKEEVELYKSKYEGCERQSAIRGQMVESLASGKSDNERLWDAMLTERIVRSSASDAELIYGAKRLVNAWKEATK